jgi:transposase
MAGKPLELVNHHSSAELEAAYRKCKDAKEKTRRQAIWLYSNKASPSEVGKVVGYSPNWVYKLVVRYNALGLMGLVDRHQENPGGDKRAILNEQERQELLQAMQGKAPDGGLWTAPKVAAWVKEKTNKTLKGTTPWRYLRGLGFTLQVPRPSHTQAATPEEQTAFKKKFTRS